MPLPAIVGVAALGGMMGSFVTRLLTWSAETFTKRVIWFGLAVAAVVAFTAGFFAAITSILDGLLVTLPSEVTWLIPMVMPSNAVACLTAIVSAHTLRFVYLWQVRLVNWKLQTVS